METGGEFSVTDVLNPSDGLERYDLAEAGAAYIRDCLKGGNSLAQALSQNCEPAGAFTLLPRGQASQRLTAFSVGGTGSNHASWTEFVIKYLANDAGRVAVAENFESRPGDPVLTKRPHHFIVGAEIYYFAQEATAPSVSLLLRSMSCYPSILCLTETERPFRTGEKGDSTLLRKLALATSHVLVGAYDEESFVCATCDKRSVAK
jgi:hypothetical protein